MLITALNGEIYDANDAFLDFIKYPLYDFIKKDNPKTWKDITLPNEALESDLHEAELCMKGQIKTYNIRKHYVPNSALPNMVDIQVTRFPLEGGEQEFEFFFVTVVDMQGETGQAIRDIHDLSVKLTKHLDSVSEKMEESLTLFKSLEKKVTQPNLINRFFDWVEKNPKIGYPTFFLFLYLIFGSKITEGLMALKEIFKFN